MATSDGMMNVEVVYAGVSLQQVVVALIVPQGATVLEVIQQSGILARFPEIDLNQQRVGIFSKRCELTDVVREGDRIEIYRPLLIDPKEARRAKAKKRGRL